MLILLLIIALYVLLTIYFAYTVYTVLSGAPFIPTSQANVKKMLKLADPKPEDNMIDLGSGDGRILTAFAPKVANCIGIEINLLLIFISKLRIKISRQKNIEIKCQNLWKADLSKADIVIAFLVPIKMDQLESKIKSEMKKGSKVISCRYTFNNLELIDQIDKVYLYRV